MDLKTVFSFMYWIVIDSFDPVVILLVVAGVLSLWDAAKRRAIPAFAALAGTVALFTVLPLRAVPDSFYFWYFLIAAAAVTLLHHLSAFRKGNKVELLLTGLFTTGVVVIVTGLSTLPVISVTHYFTVAVVFLILSSIVPTNFLSPVCRKEIHIFFLILAFGLFSFRASVWVYTAFQSYYKDPQIWFETYGPVTGVQMAKAWNFPHLVQWVEEEQYNWRESLIDETPFSSDQIELLEEGLIEAEKFRLSLLENDEQGAKLIVKAILKFQQEMDAALVEEPFVYDFYLDEDLLLQSVRGREERVYGSLAFADFSGKWYGKWDQMHVDHDWGVVQLFNSSVPVQRDLRLCVRSLQYAWIGDGFGWNAVISPDCKNVGDVILGTVFHVSDGDPSQIRLRRPHVGIEVDKGQLIWITREEIFLEQAFLGEQRSGDTYAITGFRYRIENGALHTNGEAFQAQYTRNPDNRLDWKQIPVDFTVQL